MRAKAILLAAAALVLAGCADRSHPVAAGDARRGAQAIVRYGCGSCHTISGIESAHGLVGPPLTGIGQRMYVAGVLENSPVNLARWIEDPKAVDDRTAMPRLGVSRQEAVDISAFLYSTR
jgi:cytochrome c